MLGDTEAAGYKLSPGHDDCSESFLWIPETFTGSNVLAEGFVFMKGLIYRKSKK